MRRTLEAVIESGIPSERFVFEVVESDEIDDVGKLMETVEECRATGCRVALDDIGNGYNSLNAMAAVRPDFIKLDRDLINGVETDIYKSRVAGKLIELAKELKIKTVVEGIETEQAWRWAVEQGADYGQGFTDRVFCSGRRPKPRPYPSFRHLIRSSKRCRIGMV